ncbi:unnamed protein product, partial [Discosporangium mesarthrocarpum]
MIRPHGVSAPSSPHPHPRNRFAQHPENQTVVIGQGGKEMVVGLGSNGDKQHLEENDERLLHDGMVAALKARDVDEVIAMYSAMRSLDYHISQNVFNGVLNVCSSTDKLSQGMQVFMDMQKAGFSPQENSYTFLLRERVGREAYGEAFDLVKSMRDLGIQPRLRTYAPIIKGLCGKMEMSLAWDVWVCMKIDGVEPSPLLYIAMMVGWARCGELWGRVLCGTVGGMLSELAERLFKLPGEEDEDLLVDRFMQAFNSGLEHPVARVSTIPGEDQDEKGRGDAERGEGGAGVCSC